MEPDTEGVRAPSADHTLLALMLQHATDGIVLVARDGTVIATTPAIERMLGMEPNVLVGRSGLELLHPDDVEAGLERLASIGTEVPDDYRTYRFQHSAGHWITVELVASENPVRIDEAPEGSLILTVRDVTEFHETRVALELSQTRREIIAGLAANFVDALDSEIDTAVECALEAIGRHTQADRVYVSRIPPDFTTMRRTHQWSRHGQAWSIDRNVEVSTDAYPTWRDCVQALELVVIEDSRAVPVDEQIDCAQLDQFGIGAVLVVPLVREGAAIGFLAVDIMDRPNHWGTEDIGLVQVVTDIIGSALGRRDASERSRSTEARFRAMVEHSSDALIVIDADARINHMPIGENLFGYKPADLFGTNALDLVHPDDLEFAATEMLKAVVDPEYQALNSMRIRHADGHWVPIELVASSRFDEPAIDGVIMNVRDVTERDKVAAQLRDSDERLGTLIANLPGVVYRCEAEPPYHDQFVSAPIESLTGYPAEDFLERRIAFDDLILDDHQDRAEHEVRARIAQRRSFVLEYPIRHRDGTVRWVSEHGRVISDPDGTPRWLEGVIFDVTARVEAEAEVARSHVWLQTLIANVPGAVFRCEAEPPYRDIFISDAIEDLTGYSPDAFVEHRVELYDLIVPEHQARVDHAIRDSIGRDAPYSIEYQFQHRDGSLRWVEERGQVMLAPSGEPLWIDGAMLDLADRKQLEHRLAHDAAHDPLTGLPNRTVLLSYLENALARDVRRPTTTGVLFLDLDRFKLVNDALGHTAGDELLVHFTRRLRSVMRTSDLAARTGGDEFVIVCSDLDDPAEAEVIAGRIANVLRDPFTVHGRTVFVTASIGIAFAEAGTNAGDVLRSADAAAYRAKDRGRNRYEVFDDALRAATAAALETETDLHRALDEHQLFLRYQPVVALETGQLAGAEGLVRWQHPERGLLVPDQFLPAAEASGLIVPMGREVLALAVGAMSGLSEAEIPTIAINLAPRELAQPDLVERVQRSLEEHGVAAHRLCIEITESAVLDEVEAAIATLESLQAIGVRLAIDDFGTGYSSLSYLRRLPVDIVKIDRSFTSEIGVDDANLTIVAGIIGLARGLGLDVIAEGVETARQLNTLRELGCTYGQGFLFAPPVAMDDLLALRSGRSWDEHSARH